MCGCVCLCLNKCIFVCVGCESNNKRMPCMCLFLSPCGFTAKSIPVNFCVCSCLKQRHSSAFYSRTTCSLILRHEAPIGNVGQRLRGFSICHQRAPLSHSLTRPFCTTFVHFHVFSQSICISMCPNTIHVYVMLRYSTVKSSQAFILSQYRRQLTSDIRRQNSTL